MCMCNILTTVQCTHWRKKSFRSRIPIEIDIFRSFTCALHEKFIANENERMETRKK